MSREHVDLVRRVFETWNEGDFGAWGAMHHPDVVVTPPPGWPEAEVSRSRDEWLAQAERLTDSWEEQRVEVESLREVGDSVLVLFNWITTGRGSQIDLATEFACVAKVGHGTITKLVYYLDRQQALEDVGLRG